MPRVIKMMQLRICSVKMMMTKLIEWMPQCELIKPIEPTRHTESIKPTEKTQLNEPMPPNVQMPLTAPKITTPTKTKTLYPHPPATLNPTTIFLLSRTTRPTACSPQSSKQWAHRPTKVPSPAPSSKCSSPRLVAVPVPNRTLL